MEGMPDFTTCGWFCGGGVASLLFVIVVLIFTRKPSASSANAMGGESRPSTEVRAGEPPGSPWRPIDDSDHAATIGSARPFPWCGVVSVAAPFLGSVALELFSRYAREDIDLRVFFGGVGPSWLTAASQTIMGCAGLAGFVLGCLALARRERLRGFAILGLLVNGPFLFLLLSGLRGLDLTITLDPPGRRILREKKGPVFPQPRGDAGDHPLKADPSLPICACKIS